MRNSTENEILEAKRLTKDIQRCLSDDLRNREYRGHPNPLRGQCYVASEAIAYLLGENWQSYRMVVKSDMGREGHWFLVHEPTGKVLDPTAGQYDEELDYSQGKRRPFLTKKPSARTRKLIHKVARHLIEQRESETF